jgi:ligand-binding SRPBCC domain-containing protein
VKESQIAAPPEVVFAFHESPGALSRLIPPWEQVEVVEAPASLLPGSRAVLRSRLGPFAFDWVAEHTEYQRGRLFADTQLHGPFASWYHRHLFLDDGQGGTILRDEVDYLLPLGMLGRALAGRFVAARLQRMFDYRHEATRRALEDHGESISPEPAPISGSTASDDSP